MAWNLTVIRLHRAFELHQQRPPFAIQGFAGRHLHPAFAHAVLLHILALLAIKTNPNIVLKHRRHKVRAAGVYRQVIGQCGALSGLRHNKKTKKSCKGAIVENSLKPLVAQHHPCARPKPATPLCALVWRILLNALNPVYNLSLVGV